MTDKHKGKTVAVLRRGMAEHDWYQSPDRPQAEQQQPFRWDIPAGAATGGQAPVETQESAGEKWSKRLRLAVGFVVMLACGLFILRSSVQGFDARGVSMEPALHNGNHIIVNKLAYTQIDLGLLDWVPLIDIHGRWATPGRGDIVVFKSPVEDKELVKRVIGLPGEEVIIANVAVYVNQAEFDEPSAHSATECQNHCWHQLDEPYVNGATECQYVCNWRVPEGQYFMLGDNRKNSLDSREGWFVPTESIDGKKLFSY